MQEATYNKVQELGAILLQYADLTEAETVQVSFLEKKKSIFNHTIFCRYILCKHHGEIISSFQINNFA